MRTVHVAAILIALMAAIRVHAQISAANTPEGFQSQFHAVFEAFQQQDPEIHQSVSSNEDGSCLTPEI